MKSVNTLKVFPTNPAAIAALIAAAPDFVDDSECSFNPNDADAVKHAFATMKRVSPPRVRGKQQTPVKKSVTIRLPPDIWAYYNRQGAGYQDRKSVV